MPGFFCSKPVIFLGGLFRFDIQTYHLESRNQDWKVREGIFLRYLILQKIVRSARNHFLGIRIKVSIIGTNSLPNFVRVELFKIGDTRAAIPGKISGDHLGVT